MKPKLLRKHSPARTRIKRAGSVLTPEALAPDPEYQTLELANMGAFMVNTVTDADCTLRSAGRSGPR